jgi:predicted ATPase
MTESAEVASEPLPSWFNAKVSFETLQLTNFLSYKSAEIRLDDFVALVGPNASGKSNAIAAIKLLRDIPIHGLPLAIARRGGFDQLRHRSRGRPYDPALRLTFRFGESALSFYELKLRALQGKRYEVKSEIAEVWTGDNKETFSSDGRVARWVDRVYDPETQRTANRNAEYRLPPGQSVLNSGGPFVSFLIAEALRSMQTVEINPARVGELQEPSSTQEFEPDGSNTASVLEGLDASVKTRLIEELDAVVGGIGDIEVARFADKMTVRFAQVMTSGAKRDFLAKQMSDGTLRAFSILLSTLQSPPPRLLVIEEPEVAIHLGALRSLVEILREQNENQILITTHSADIIDALPIDKLRVVWNEDGESHVAEVAEHTQATVREGLITPGQLLRADALDPKLS